MSTGAVPQRGATQSPARVEMATIATAPASAWIRAATDVCGCELSSIGGQMEPPASLVESGLAKVTRLSCNPHGIFMTGSRTSHAMNEITADNLLPVEQPAAHHGPKETLPKLMLGAIGIVYGDIGTSPLYAMKESFLGPHPLSVDRLHIFGVLSLIFWSLMLIVTIKYVFVAMRADNKGEGGSFALLSLIARNFGGKKWTATLITLGVLATSLF